MENGESPQQLRLVLLFANTLNFVDNIVSSSITMIDNYNNKMSSSQKLIITNFQ